MKAGKFLICGGLDQTGKTTQTNHLTKWLEKQGKSVIHTFEPGGTPLGCELRSLLMKESYSPKTQWLLYLAAREEHLEKVIRPAIQSGTWVVCDRFFETTFLFQGLQGISEELLWFFHHGLKHHTPAPALELLFTGRVGKRREDEKTHYDRFSDEHRDAMTNQVKRYAQEAEKAVLLEVSGKTEHEVFEEILEYVTPLL
ncbi:dTMP kinase [Cytobacillus sp. FJAT-54145]|uniref:Thymidylate kinase n=1 Tax=Cytobacillus spartinae TaxID=3299023 RepID=A0ABW6KAT2_9BACI